MHVTAETIKVNVMKTKNFPKILSVLAAILLICAIIISPVTTTAKADMGPKPFVEITFKNLPDGNLYCTLLSKTESTGPYSHDYSHYQVSGNETVAEIDNAFSSYTDKDGFYYLHYFSLVDNDTPFRWGYYPPHTFKILIYSKTEDKFIVNDEILERYAFSSYFTSDYAGATPNNTATDIKTVKSYNYFLEIVKLILRIAVTIGIEIAIALLFRYRGNKLTFIVIVNVITQVLLNIGLNLYNYNSGALAMGFYYILWEIVVLIVETLAYIIGMRIIENKNGEKHRFFLIHLLYALAANIASFGIGVLYLIVIGI